MTVFANLKIQPEKRRKGTYELYACFSSAKESFCDTVDMERTQNRVLPENQHKIFEYLEIREFPRIDFGDPWTTMDSNG